MDNILINVYKKDALGDNLAWIPSYDEYQKKNKCNLFVCVKKFIRDIVEKQYPNIHFIDRDEIDNYKFYKVFDLIEEESKLENNLISGGLIKFCENILNVKTNNIPPKFDLSSPRQIKEPYICISVQAHDYIKTWSRPYGWGDVINYLKNILGYKVICVDKNRLENYKFKYFDIDKKETYIKKKMPNSCIDETGPFSLQKRIDLIKDADFFIGASSGLSWLAWGCRVPVVLISGFTKPENEFYTPYRVYPEKGCRDCQSRNWGILKEDFQRCKFVYKIKSEIIPECSMNITPQMVIDKINQIPIVQLRLSEYWKNHPIS